MVSGCQVRWFVRESSGDSPVPRLQIIETKEKYKMAQEQKELINLIKANIKIIQIVSYETMRIYANMVDAASELGCELYLWKPGRENQKNGTRKSIPGR
jgi:hypothetical protein